MVLGGSRRSFPTLPANSSALDPFGEAFEKRLAELEGMTEGLTLATDYGTVEVVKKRGDVPVVGSDGKASQDYHISRNGGT